MMTYIDPVTASPKHYKTLLENDQVRENVGTSDVKAIIVENQRGR